jgi:hypothetical protein
MREQTTVLYEATNLDTPATLAGALAHVEEYFGAQPSFPDNVLELVFCGVRITETTFETGPKRRLEITKPNGVVLYETEWKWP